MDKRNCETQYEQQITQNVAFGTSQKPEGFVATWRKASHTWRFRAVLCVFLSLLLTMMQPSGNALYRSWNANTGETMGLALAITQGEGNSQLDLVSTNLDLSSSDEDAVMTPAAIGDRNSIIRFNEDMSKAEVIEWYKTTGNTVTLANGKFDEVERQEDNKYLGTQEGLLTKDESIGNMGYVTWIGPTGDEEFAGENDFEIVYSPSMTTVGYYMWALGYKLSTYASVSSESLVTKAKGTIKGSGVDGEYIIPERYAQDYTLLADDDNEYIDDDMDPAENYLPTIVGSNDSGYLESNLYGKWEKRNSYGVIVMECENGEAAYNDNGILNDCYDDPEADEDATAYLGALEWDTAIPYMSGFNHDGLRWKVYPMEDPSTPKAWNGTIAADDAKFGQLVNPNNSGSPSYDPANKQSDFYSESMAGDVYYVGISPVLEIRYDPNGGAGDPVSYAHDVNFTNRDTTFTTAPLASGENAIYNGSGFTMTDDGGNNVTLLGWAIDPKSKTADISFPVASGAKLSDALKGTAYEGYITDAGVLTKSITLYAVWDISEKTNYPVTLKNDSSDDITVSVGDTVVADSPVTYTFSESSAPTFGGIVGKLDDDTTWTPKASIPAAKYATSVANGTPATLSWTHNGSSDGATVGTDGSAVFTATVEPAKYSVTVNVDTASGNFNTTYGNSITVKNVPYGIAYDEIKLITDTKNGGYKYDPAGTLLESALVNTASGGIRGSKGPGTNGAWTGDWSVTKASDTDASLASTTYVTGNDTYTFTYDVGLVTITYAKADVPIAGGSGNKDFSDSKFSTVSVSGIDDQNGNATGYSASGSSSNSNSWKTETLDVPWGTKKEDLPEFPKLEAVGGALSASKYSNIDAGGTSALDWGSQAYPATITTNKTYTGTPQLTQYTVQAKVIEKDAAIETAAGTVKGGSSGAYTTIGTLYWGDLPSSVITSSIVPNSVVFENVSGTSTPQYTHTGATWSTALSTAVTAPDTTSSGTLIKRYDYQVPRQTATVNVSVSREGGTWTGTLNGEHELTFTGVPYGTTLENAKFTGSDASYTYDAASGLVTFANLTRAANTDASFTGEGSWNDTSKLTTLVSSTPISMTYSYDGYHAVTFKIVGGKWSDGSTGDITYYVPDKKTLKSDGVKVKNSTNPDDKFLAVPTGMVRLNNGYMETAAWAVVGSGTNLITSDEPNDGAIIENDVTYTYTFVKASKNYKVNVYYQKADPVTGSEGKQADYEQPAGYTGKLTIEGSADYLNTVTMATVLNDAGITSTWLGDNHYQTSQKSHTNGVQSVGASFTMNDAGFETLPGETGYDENYVKEVNVYFDRETLTYSYKYNSAPSGATALPNPNGGTVRYNQEITMFYPDPLAYYDFDGWYANSSSGTQITAQKVNLTTNTVFQGNWSLGSYDVTYDFIKDSIHGWVTNDGTNFQAKLKIVGVAESATEGASITQSGRGKNAAAATPTLSVANPEKYEITGWYYKVVNPKLSNQPTEWTALDAGKTPSDIEIKEAGYHFAPQLGVKKYTVLYTEGSHGEPMGEVDNVTKFTVAYDEAIPAPIFSGTTDGKENYTLAHVQQMGTSGSYYYAPYVKTAEIYAYKAQQPSVTYPWKATSATSSHVGAVVAETAPYGTVKGNVELEYKWDPILYTLHFKNIKGATNNPAANDPNDKDTYNYTGTYNTSTYESNAMEVSTKLTWYDSIFAGLTNNKNVSTPDEYVNLVAFNFKDPSKDGYHFDGWQRGSSTTADAEVIKAGGNNITVGEAFKDDTNVYLYAKWTGNSVKLTYHRNTGGDLNKGVSWGTGANQVTEASAVNSTMVVGENPMLDSLSGLKVSDTGADFAPAGYTFGGWYERSDGKDPSDATQDGTPYIDQSKEYTVKADTVGGSATNNLYAKWTANTYTAQFRDFKGKMITNYDVYSLYASDFTTAPDLTTTDTQTCTLKNGSSITFIGGIGTSTSSPTFTLNCTYNVPTTLPALEKLFTDSPWQATHNPSENVLAGWKYDDSKPAINDGGVALNLTTRQGANVILAASEGNKVILSYDLIGGVGVSTDEVTLDGGGEPVSSQYDAQGAKFTLQGALKRTGYDFNGWKIGATVYQAGDQVTLNSDATAVAQWTPKNYTVKVNYYVQKGISGADAAAYDPVPADTKTFSLPYRTTATAGIVSADGNDLTSAVVETYNSDRLTFNSSKSTKTVTVPANDNATIDLYYTLDTYTVKYEYTGLYGTSAGVEPEKDQVTVPVGEYTLQYLPAVNGPYWPTGFESEKTHSWYLGNDAVTTVTVHPTTVDKDGCITVHYPFKPKKLNVTFKLDTATPPQSKPAAGSDAVTVAGLTKQIDYDTAPSTAMSNIKIEKDIADAAEAARYEVVGWYVEGDTSQTIIDMGDPVTADTTFVVKVAEVNAVVWRPGAHSASKFSTASKVTQTTDAGNITRGPTIFANLGKDFEWVCAKLTLDATGVDIVQSTDTVALAKGAKLGDPAAQPGWKFAGFKDGDNNVYGMELNPDTGVMESNGKWWDEISALTDTDRSYTFTANWDPTEQTVTFDKGVGATGAATSPTLAGNTGSGYTAAGAEAKAPAEAPAAKVGYTFEGYWLGTFEDETGKKTTMKLKPGDPFDFPAKDATLVAQWSHDDVKIDFESNNDDYGRVSLDTTGTIFADTATNYVVEALPNPGYKFVGWVNSADQDAVLAGSWNDPTLKKYTDDGNGNRVLTANYGKLTVQRNGGLYESATYIAKFEPDPYIVKFVDSDDPDQGTVTGPSSLLTQNVDRDQDKNAKMTSDDGTVDFTANDGYSKSGWSYVVEEEQLDANGKLEIVRRVSTGIISDPTSVAIVGNTTFKAEYSAGNALLIFQPNPQFAGQSGFMVPFYGMKSGQLVTLPACDYTLAGYTFAGWSTTEPTSTTDKSGLIPNSENIGKGGTQPDQYKMQGTRILYPLWDPIHIKVKYIQNDPNEANGGNSETVNVEYGPAVAAATPGEDPLTGITAPSSTRGSVSVPSVARSFDGWNIDSEGRGTKFTGTIPQNLLPTTEGDTLELFAQWKDNGYTVTFTPGIGGGLIDEDAPANLSGKEYGEVIPLPNAEDYYARPNHYFVGWEIKNEDGPIDAKWTSNTWTFGGITTGANAGKVSNVTMSAVWEKDPGVDAKVNVTLANMNALPGVSGASMSKTLATLTGLSKDDKPIANGAYENLTTQGAAYANDQYFTFRGWYATDKGSGALSPATAFGAKQNDFLISDKNVTVQDIIETYYTTSKPLDGYYQFPGDPNNVNLPEWWDDSTAVGAYTQAYTKATSVDLTLYRWAELSRYKVVFHPNAPTGYTDAEVTGKMDDQVVPVYDAEDASTDPDDYKLATNKYSFKGYRFLGWQTKPNEGNVLPVQTELNGSQKKAGSIAVEDKQVLMNNGALLTAASTTCQVDLYAVWAKVDNSVQYVMYYPDDGIGTYAQEEMLGDAKTDYAWTDTISAPSGVTMPTASTHYPNRDDVSFGGWYTVENTNATTNGALVEVNTSTIASVVTNPNFTGTPAGDGSYSLKLYAKWIVDGVRVHYEAGDATDGTPPGDDVGSFEAGQNETTVTVSPNVLKKTGYTADGWTNKDDPTKHFADGSSVSFTKGENESKTVTLVAAFKDNDYPITYDYDTVAGYDGTSVLNNSMAVPGKVGNSPLKTATLHWASKLYEGFDTVPTLEGYTFGGFVYRVDENTEIPIVRNLTTVEGLRTAIAAVKGGAVSDSTDKITLSAKWVPITYDVQYSMSGGELVGGGDPNTTATWFDTEGASGRALVLPSSVIARDGYSNPTWYVNSACTKPEGGLPTNATLYQIVKAWHEADASHTGEVQSPITLYAKWREETVTVIFTVSDPARATITAGAGTAGDHYTTNESNTQVVYQVGARSGFINGDPSYGSLPVMTAEAKSGSGYVVSSWKNGATTVGGGSTFQLSTYNDPTGAKRYVGATYVAQIEGDSDVGLNVKYCIQKTDGSWPTSATPLAAKASDFNKGMGGTISVDELDKFVRDAAPDAFAGTGTDGLSVDTDRTSPLVVADGANTTLYYNRAQHDLTYAWVYEGGNPTPTPTRPADESLYVGQISTATLPTFTDATVPAGYEWRGWYSGFTTVADLGNATLVSTGGAKVTMGAADIALTGVFKKTAYTIDWDASKTLDGGAAQSTDAQYVGTPASPTVASGQTLNDSYDVDNKTTTGYKVVLTDKDGNVTQTFGNADKATADVVIKVGDGNSIIWRYEVGGKTYDIVDPTAVPITGDGKLYPVVTLDTMVSYLPGTHGTFPTQTFTATLDETTNQYKVADYRFPADQKEDNESGTANAGNPKGEDGWVFAGWNARYVSNSGNIVEKTALTDKMLGTDADLQIMSHSVVFTAQWRAGNTLVQFDLSAPQGGYATPSFKDGVDFTTEPVSMKIFDPDDPSAKALKLPLAGEVECDGYTLSKWQWTDDGGTPDDPSDDTVYEFDPGDDFEVPARPADAVTPVKAIWTEDEATIEYKTVDANKAWVTVSSEKVKVWTGTPKGSSGRPADSGYVFSKWTLNDEDGTALTAGVTAATAALVPQRVDGRYVDATYYVTFTGTSYTVTFGVAADSVLLGSIQDKNNEQPPTVNFAQTVAHGSNASMSDLSIVARDGYEIADGLCWDYVMYDGNSTTELVKAATDNPADPNLKILGNTTFLLHFKESSGEYKVTFVTGEGATTVDPVYRKWSDGNLGANKSSTLLGYEQNGWWTDIPGTQAKDPQASNYKASPGNVEVGTQAYSTLAGGASHLAEAKENGITLRAGWVEKTGYSVNFDLNYPGAPDATPTPDLKWNDVVSWSGTSPSGVPERTGYDFKGWYTARTDGDRVVANADGSSMSTKYSALAGQDDRSKSQTVYAQWEEHKYWVEYLDESGKSFSPKKKMAPYTLNEALNPENNPDPDKVFRPSADDTVDRVFSGWVYRRGANWAKVGSNTTVQMIADAQGETLSNNSQTEPVKVQELWTYRYYYDTKFLLELDRDPQAVSDGRNIYFLDSPDTVRREWSDRDAEVTMKTDYEVPGFEYSPSATKLFNQIDTNAEWLEYTTRTLDDNYEYEAGAIEANGALFTQVYYAKPGYGVRYDLNDKTVHPGGVAFTASLPAGVASYANQTGKTFVSANNTPVEWTEATPPTRMGFTFGGWYNEAVADNVEATDDIAKAADATTLYGSLAYRLVDGEWQWYDPLANGGDGFITLHANWNELTHSVKYAVASDMVGCVEIRLNSEPATAFSSAERTETIGAATGDLFTRDANGQLVRQANATRGAVAKAARGYTLAGWRVVDETLPSGAKYNQSLGVVNAMNTASAVAATGVAAANAMGSASSSELTTEAVGTTSHDGISYATTSAIYPGTRSDNNLFGGTAASGTLDPTASNVVYVAVAETNSSATVTINPDNGTGTTSTTQPYGTYIGERPVNGVYGQQNGALPETPKKTGYAFAGWKTSAETVAYNADGSEVSLPAGTIIPANAAYGNRIVIPKGGIALTAQWTDIPAKISFKPNGGTGAMADVDTLVGLTETIPASGFTRTGYTFTDWNTASNGSGTAYQPGAKYTVAEGGLTLYAQWKANPASIKFVANGGTGTMADISSQVDKTETIPDSVFARTDYAFVNWNTAADGTGTTYKAGDQYKMTEAGLTLYAQWVQSVKDINKATIVAIPEYDYTSYAITPTLTVMLDGRTLLAGTDYTVLYTNNVEVGTATATITGKGMYKGTKSATFKINHIAYKQGFTDLSMNDWYWKVNLDTSSNEGNFKGIETLYLDLVFARQYMVGYKDGNGNLTGKFGPHDNVTRAQAATILYRIANQGTTDTYNPSDYAKNNTTGLPDVRTGEYYTAAVNWAQANGVITGYGTPGNYYAYGPNDFVTREQMATMIYRFCVLYYGGQNRSQALTYVDAGSVSSWARAGVQYCSAMNIMAGYGTSGVYDPQGNATRCQVAKIVGVAVHDAIDKM